MPHRDRIVLQKIIQEINVAWKDAAGMRDIAAHRYQTLRMEDVFNSAKIDFSKIREQLQDILNQSAENGI